MSWKKSLLVILKILGLFVNIMTADDKYSLLNRENLTQQIQIQSTKKNFFFDFISIFFKYILNFKHFGTKDEPHNVWIDEITYCERRG